VSDFDLVAVDIETTGFSAHDVVTVLGFDLPLGSRVFCNTDSSQTDNLESTLQKRLTRPLVCSTHNSEADLLRATTAFTDDRLRDDDALIIAYNGETWGGGFAVPFLRTRFALENIDWPFRDLPYADLLPLISDLFNTTIDGDEQADLETAYDVLCTGSLDELDPFDDSSEAATAFEAGQFEQLVRHNLSDIRRTRQLGALAQQYCSKSDFNLKSLTPTIHD
jgi:uncharacterized protein YprB with RNaseH-like and TPR domain